MNKEYTVISDLIPQISFDIIGRICPGLLILISWFLIYWGPIKGSTVGYELIKNNKILSFGFLVLIVILCYMLSILIFGMKRIFSRKDNPIDVLSGKIDIKDNAIKFDILRVKFPVVGARLNKLRAETQGAQVLFYGFLIDALLNIYPLIKIKNIERIIFEIILVLCSISAFTFYQYISKIYNLSLDNHYRNVSRINQQFNFLNNKRNCKEN
jgi:hypothetical protein